MGALSVMASSWLWRLGTRAAAHHS